LSPTPPLPHSPTPLLIRPLLAITRGEVEAYCDEHRLNYRIDATNVADDFTRNRVRRDVLPALRAINPLVVEAIARAAENLAADQSLLDKQASGKRLQLPGGLEVWREFEAIIFKRIDKRVSELAARGYAFALSAAHSRVEAGGLLLTIERGQPASRLPSLLGQ